jgi:hypothetical protein
LALDERYAEGWVAGCLERIGEDDPEEERATLPTQPFLPSIQDLVRNTAIE